MNWKGHSAVVLTLHLQVPVQSNEKDFCHFGFTFTVKVLSLLVVFFEVAIQWKWKGLSTVILILLSKWGWNFLVWSSFWKSQFNEMKRTFICFNCHLSFVFTAKTKLSLLSCFFESHNSIKTKRTLNRHLNFTFKVRVKFSRWVIFLKVAVQWNEKDFHLFQLSFELCFHSKN